MKQLRKTKIVGTIGPASENKLEELFNAGLNVTRVNYSHGSWDEQSEKTESIIKLRKELDIPVALLLDMKGPEIRTGMLYTGKNKKIELKDGQKFTLFNEDIEGNEEGVSVTYKELYKDVVPGTKILIDDGAIELKVDEVVGKDIITTVVHGNGLGSRKTMNLPGTIIRLPGLADKDIADLKTACEHGYDYIVLSFARAMGEFGATLMIAGNIPGKTQTMPLAIFFAVESGDMSTALKWVAIIVFISFIMIMILNYWSEYNLKITGKRGR